MKTSKQYISGFKSFVKRRNKGKRTVMVSDIEVLQLEYCDRLIRQVYLQGYVDGMFKRDRKV